MTNAPKCDPWLPSPGEMFLALSLAVGMTMVFWWPLWMGGGLQGGDLYSYYMPQKMLLAESIQAGRLPMWNDLTGFGYPALAESQTGVLYPPNWVLYRIFDVNSAYVVSQLFHYVIAFLATWGLIRQLKLSQGAAAIGAIAFVYGWLPPRICLEWAVIGAAYFAIILWTGIAWLQTGCPRSLGALSIALGLCLLAGHFHLAFITILGIAVIAGTIVLRRKLNGVDAAEYLPSRTGWLVLGLMGGFLIAAVQLIPTWELKKESQRDEVGEDFDPAYGHIPPMYLTQLIAPWIWHGPEISADKALEQPSPGRYPTATNKVEAHLYVGTIPLLLAAAVLAFRYLQRSEVSLLPWILMGGLGLCLVTAWPLVLLKHVPGFSFFMGPGRYGMLTAMAITVLAACGWDAVLATWLSPRYRHGTLIAVCLVTVVDLYAVSREYTFGVSPFFGRQVFYATLLDEVPIDFLDESDMGEAILEERPTARLYAPGANIPSLLGVSSLPVYLGLGPEIYFDPNLNIDFQNTSPAEIQTHCKHLRDWGVTHLLLQHRIESSDWPIEYKAQIMDPVVNRAMGRMEPFYLYELTDAPARAWLESGGKVVSFESRPNTVQLNYQSKDPTKLHLVDLAYPGWMADVDGEPVQLIEDGPFRSIEVPAGEHMVTWRFRPLSVLIGAVVSLLSFIGIVTASWIAFRRRLMCQLNTAKG